MKINLSKRAAVRIISFLLAFVLIFAGTVVYDMNRVASLRRQLAHRYQAAMENLSSEMENISVTLGKALYTGTPSTLSTLTNKLVLQAGTASTALAELPINHNSLEKVSKFLNQISDYSLALTKNVVRGGSISDAERSNLIKLSEIAKNLSVGLGDATTMYNSTEVWSQNIEAALKDTETISGLDSTLGEAEESLSDYPTLIYDGPFSDHILEKESQMLKAAKEVSVDEAKQKAAKQFNLKPDDLHHTRTEEGKMPAYIFSFDNGTVAVTKKGGYICYFRREKTISYENTDYEKAVETAKKYISSLNIGNFETSYYFADEGMCVVNFAYVQGDTICYPDLIKIGIALDNYDVIFYEARGYLMNHKGRTLKIPLHTAKEASEIINPHLKIQSTHLAVIPSSGENELYCYEFLCKGEKNEDILVYVNTETLAEEQIFILLKTDGGTLTK